MRTTNFMCFDALTSGVVSKRLLNETTWNKQRHRKRTDNTGKTSFQQANQLLNQQTHRADLQPKTDSQLPRSITTKERNNRLKNSNPLI
ncbi:hypothetical protein FORC72_1696 [Vibrio parahaemolyticus]|nr:hypothetical protein FORC72_1696 [Vibrio parahaemolyticus]